MSRNVRGVLFADYVRMIRSQKHVDWSRLLRPEDAAYLRVTIVPGEWYPMETFERLGNAILHEAVRGDLGAVRMWGRFSADRLRANEPQLVAAGDPVETLMRFRVLRSTYFNFDALEIPTLTDGHAEVIVRYHMSDLAEEAASHQTVGFFERLLELGGAADVSAQFVQRVWADDPCTRFELSWTLGDG